MCCIVFGEGEGCGKDGAVRYEGWEGYTYLGEGAAPETRRGSPRRCHHWTTPPAEDNRQGIILAASRVQTEVVVCHGIITHSQRLEITGFVYDKRTYYINIYNYCICVFICVLL